MRLDAAAAAAARAGDVSPKAVVNVAAAVANVGFSNAERPAINQKLNRHYKKLNLFKKGC